MYLIVITSLECWNAYHVAVGKVQNKFGRAYGSSIADVCSIFNVDEVGAKRRYGLRHGMTLAPKLCDDSFGLQQCDSVDQNLSVLAMYSSHALCVQ